MKNNKIIIASLIAIVLVVGIAIGVSKGNSLSTSGMSAGEKPVITVGYILPLSGNVAFLGEGMKNAAEIAIRELESQQTKYRYKAIFEDDAFNPKMTATAASKLINIDKVDAIVTIASAAGGVVNPMAEQAKVIHLATASDPAIAKGNFNFINWTPPSEEVKVFVAEAKKRDIKRIAVFGQKISGITAVIAELKQQIVGTDIEIVFEDISNFGTKDFRTIISKSEMAHPDYNLILMFSPELEILARQMKEIGVKTPMTAIESFEMSDAPAMFEGMWYVNAADPTADFSQKYKTAYNKDPSIGTPNSYDMVKLMAYVAEKFDGKRKPTTTELANALTNMTGYNGALGDNLSIDKDGLLISKAVLRIIKDGKPVDFK